MKVVVTGGAGFIGSHVVDHLIDCGHAVVVIDNLASGSRQNVNEKAMLYNADIRDADRMEQIFDIERPDCVCHQAAQISVSASMSNPVLDADVNVMGTLNLLESSVAFGVRQFVFASTGGAMYGECHGTAATEQRHPHPISPYGMSKLAAERYVDFYQENHSLRSISLRYANVYGPRQNPLGEAGVVAIFTRKMLNGEPPTINGDGTCVRDYVHVRDVARANVLAIENGPPVDILNIGTSVPRSVNEIYDDVRMAVSSIVPHDVPRCVHGAPREGDLQFSVLDNYAARSYLKWTPTVDYREGIYDTVRWFNDIRLTD